MNHQIIYVGGIKGVGKTTLLNALKSQLSYEIVDVTIQMREYTNLLNRDKLDEITVLDRFRAREYAFPKALELTKQHKLIFDSHFSIPSIYGHEWGFPVSFLPYIGALILITSTPNLILERRKKNMSRNRGRGTLSEITLDIEIENRYAEFTANLINKSLYFLENNDLEVAKQSFLETIYQIEKKFQHSC